VDVQEVVVRVLGFHLLCGVLHHQIVDFLGVLGPPFLLVVGVIVLMMTLCCLDEGGHVGWVIRDLNDRFFEFVNRKCSEGPIIFKAVCKMLGDGFDVEVEGGRRFGSPCVVENDMLKTLSGCCKCCFLWGKSAMVKKLLSSFNFGFLFSLHRWQGSRGSHPIVVGCQSDKSGSMV
jgi:hypothetical protein